MAAPNIVNVSTITGITTGAALTTTLTTTLLSNSAASNKVFKINSIIVANVDGTNAADVTVDWYNGTTGYKLANTITVPADATLVVVGKDTPIYLQENTSIRGGASANGDLECVISYEEIS
jgi:hypothetical protein